MRAGHDLGGEARPRAPLLLMDCAAANDELSQILEDERIHAVYQPIVRIRGGEVFGFEGLIRGPVGGELHTPARLFDAARRAGRLAELEWLCCRKVVEGFLRLDLRQRLFLNISPETVACATDGSDLLHALCPGSARERIVIELTEHEQARDVQTFHRAMSQLRSGGFGVALDDLGEGFSSLRLWSEINPDFVKVDMHFVQGVHSSPFKFQFLKSLQQIAENCGSLLVAEGVEDGADLTVLRDLGVAFGQGYLIARPMELPAASVDPAIRQRLNQGAIAVFPEVSALPGRAITAERLLLRLPPVLVSDSNDEVFARFEAAPELSSLAVVDRDGTPKGLISRHRFIAAYARPYRKELYGRRPCSVLMDANPVMVRTDITLHELSETLVDADARHLGEGFILTETEGRYAGVGSAQDLIREMTRLQVEAARYANPLTLLPGNVPIDAHMERLLAAGIPFSAAYCDINHFKPFNDAYGYRRGDDMIKLAASVLTRVRDPQRDFLGHIGGDDFILLMQSEDWEARCNRAAEIFGAEAAGLFDRADLDGGGLRGEDRQGNALCFPLSSLAIGVVRVSPGDFASHLEVATAAAEAKKHAKRLGGNVTFVERRRPG